MRPVPVVQSMEYIESSLRSPARIAAPQLHALRQAAEGARAGAPAKARALRRGCLWPTRLHARAPDGHGRSISIEKLAAWPRPASAARAGDMARPGARRRLSSKASSASDMAACAPTGHAPASPQMLLSTCRLARPCLAMTYPAPPPPAPGL